VIRMQTYGMLNVKDAFKGLHDELVALGANEARKTLTRAARKAFAPVLEAARANAPVDSGLTRDNIVIATQKAQEDGDGVVTVGLRIRKSKETRLSKHAVSKGGTHRMATSPHWRWHFIEGGTSSQSARPFLRPALDANAGTVLAVLGSELRKAIDRVLKNRARAAKGST
jgi:HK97 gp10 family phage protein